MSSIFQFYSPFLQLL